MKTLNKLFGTIVIVLTMGLTSLSLSFGEVVENKDIINGWYQNSDQSKYYCFENKEDIWSVKVYVYDQNKDLINKKLGLWASSRKNNLSFSMNVFTNGKMKTKNAKVIFSGDDIVSIDFFNYPHRYQNTATLQFSITPDPTLGTVCGGTAANDEIAKTDLRNFSTEEVTYHGVNGTYTGVLADLLPGFSPDEDVTVTIEGADSLGFCATAVHSNGTGTFYLGYGVRPATCTSEPVNYIEGGGEIVKLGPATDGCLAVAAQEIQTVRSQIELYKIQHNDNAPGRGGTYTSTSEMTFFPDGTLSDPSQMVIKTDVNGNPGSDFGPYWPYEWVTQALFLYLSEVTGEVEMVSSGCAE
jgi:hypothetical protein